MGKNIYSHPQPRIGNFFLACEINGDGWRPSPTWVTLVHLILHQEQPGMIIKEFQKWQNNQETVLRACCC